MPNRQRFPKTLSSLLVLALAAPPVGGAGKATAPERGPSAAVGNMASAPDRLVASVVVGAGNSFGGGSVSFETGLRGDAAVAESGPGQALVGAAPGQQALSQDMARADLVDAVAARPAGAAAEVPGSSRGSSRGAPGSANPKQVQPGPLSRALLLGRARAIARALGLSLEIGDDGLVAARDTTHLPASRMARPDGQRRASARDAVRNLPVSAAPARAGWLGRAVATAAMAGFALFLSLLSPLFVLAKPLPPGIVNPPARVLHVANRGSELLIARAEESVEQDDVVRVSSLSELKSAWTPDHAVYVVGGFPNGPSEGSLRRLAGQLKGRHWTIVLFATFSGQSYRDADGNVRYGQEAVEYFLSQRIEGDARFQEFRNSLGESDGKIWFWGMREKFRNYIGSEAQNKRGLGTDQYANMGPLDAPWLEQMRSNRDVVKAIERMADNIDSQLDDAVKGELAQAGSQVRQASAKVAQLQQAFSDLASANAAAAKAAGPFDFAALRAQVQRAEAELSAGHPAKALEIAQRVIAAADRGIASLGDVSSALASAQQAITQAEAALKDLAVKTAAFRAQRGHGLGGDIGSEQIVKQLQARLVSARNALAAGQAQEALDAAQGVLAKANAAVSAMDSYASAAGELSSLQKRLALVEHDPFAASARAELLKARQAYQDAQASYQKGNSSYRHDLEQAQQAVKSAEVVVSEAAAAHARAVAAFWLLLTLLTAGLAGALAFLNLRARRSRAKTLKELGVWRSILTSEQEKRYTETDAAVSMWVGAAAGQQGSFGYEGETARLADEARVYFDLMRRLWEKAQATIESAESLAKPKAWSLGWWVNLVWPSRYGAALAKLQRPLEFLPEEGLDKQLGIVRASALKEKLGKVGASRQYSFTDIMSLYDGMNDTVLGNAEQIKRAKAQAKPEMGRLESLIAQAEASKQALDVAGKDDGLFLVPTVFTGLLPAARRSLVAASGRIAKDPVGAIKKDGAEAARMAGDASALVALILEARPGALAIAAQQQKALEAGGIETSWADKVLSQLSGRAEALAVKAVGEPLAAAHNGKPAVDKLAEFRAQLDGFAGLMAQAAALEKSLRETALPKIAEARAAVIKARERIGQALGIAPEAVLVEFATPDLEAEIQEAIAKKAAAKQGTLEPAEVEGVMREIHQSRTLDPIAKLDAASAQAAAARVALNEGQVADAVATLDRAGDFHDVARAILEATVAAFEAREQALLARRAQTQDLRGALPEASQALGRLQSAYADSALALTAGDPSHPNADGTVTNNLDEANAHIAQAQDKTDKAEAAFQEGKILLAANLLEQAQAHQELARHRLQEISEKEARLAAAVAGNRAALAKLERRYQDELSRLSGDLLLMQPTLDAIKAATGDFHRASDAVGALKGDPFKAQAQLAAVKAAFDRIKGLAQNDRDLWHHANSTVKAADAAIESARQQGRLAQSKPGARGDDAIARAQRELDGLETRFASAQRALSREHNDWNALDHEASDIASRASRCAAVFRQEAEAADEAQAAIQSAAGKVREATGWSGHYGVTVPGSPGSRSVQSARSALDSGDYEQAKRQANQAYEAAAGAIAEAMAAVARRRREEEEEQRREEERRREREEEERRERSSSGSSSWGSGSSSGYDSGGSSWGSGSSGGYDSGGSSFGGGSSGGY